MEMNDMVMISVDDHMSEPPEMFDKHLTGDAYATAPKLNRTSSGTSFWRYQGRTLPSVGLNAVVSRSALSRDEPGLSPTIRMTVSDSAAKVTAGPSRSAGCGATNPRVTA